MASVDSAPSKGSVSVISSPSLSLELVAEALEDVEFPGVLVEEVKSVGVGVNVSVSRLPDSDVRVEEVSVGWFGGAVVSIVSSNVIVGDTSGSGAGEISGLLEVMVSLTSIDVSSF